MLFILFTIDSGLGSQIKSSGENSFAVKLSLQVMGMEPQIIPSIMDKPIPSALDGNKTNFEEKKDSEDSKVQEIKEASTENNSTN